MKDATTHERTHIESQTNQYKSRQTLTKTINIKTIQDHNKTQQTQQKRKRTTQQINQRHIKHNKHKNKNKTHNKHK